MTNKTPRTLTSHKDVQIAFLIDGLDRVETMLNEGKTTKSTVRRALKELQGSGKDVAELERWYADNFGALGRGRGGPRSGDKRTYKAQKVKNSSPFIRLPLDSLGIDKGQNVHVSFEDDVIKVSK